MSAKWLYPALVLLCNVLPQVSSAAVQTDYRLGTGDEIEIQVYDEDDLSMSVQLSEAGSFNYPYLGSIAAKGKTVTELESLLTAGLLEDILVNPSVTVYVKNYRNFFIGGEVKRPGGFSYQPGITVKQAIVLGGGVTDWASTSKFEILREGETRPKIVDEKAIVQPGDTITVVKGLF